MLKFVLIAVAVLIAYGYGGIASLVTLGIGIAVGCVLATKWYDKTGLLRPSRVIRIKR